jgi:nicotinamidase-related amidase
LRQKIDPPHTALLVIDMQNDFIAEGGLISRDGRDTTEAKRLAERLPTFIDAARAAPVKTRNSRNREGS